MFVNQVAKQSFFRKSIKNHPCNSRSLHLHDKMSDYGGGDDDGPGGMDDYDGGYEEAEEPLEPEIDDQEAADEATNGMEDPDARRPATDNVVVGGDPTATARPKNAVVAHKEKRIPNDKRNTTPYMTKYERARVLGTRALQIRFA